MKNWVKHASKEEIVLAIFQAFRELLLAVRVFRLRLAVLSFGLRLAVLASELFSGFLLVHSIIYGTHKQHTIKKRNNFLIVELGKEEIRKLKIGVVFSVDFWMARPD